MKKKFNYLLVIIILIFIALIIHIYNSKGILKIRNRTGETLSNIKLIYSNTNETIVIPKLDKNSTYKLKINDSIEQALSLSFSMIKDDNTYIFSNDIIGYIYKGYPSETKTITRDNGNFKIE